MYPNYHVNPHPPHPPTPPSPSTAELSTSKKSRKSDRYWDADHLVPGLTHGL